MKEEKKVTTVEDPTLFGKGLAGVASVASSIRSAAILHIAKKLNKPGNTFAKTVLGKNVKSIADVGAHVEVAKLSVDFITSLAEKIDRFLATNEEDEIAEPVVEEPVVEEAPAVEAFAAVEPVENDEDEDDEDSLPAGLASLKLDYIDVMEEPEKYQEMLAQEARGEVTLVTRYRRSFMSRLIQSQGNVQDYYTEIKNQLLSYKGVKSRVSWSNESINKGRTQVAKIVAKSKTLYIYLAIDPKTLEDASYEVVDVSDKKKYAAVPALIKVRGDRKFKFVMDLIRQICENDLALPPVKDFAPEDYHLPYSKTEALVQEGLVKKFVAAIPAERA
ncbi:MAG: hypothetical protein IJW16_03815 [Clostridia bacterium]|nr:hypothetical protein [Clostridia bacterium]